MFKSIRWRFTIIYFILVFIAMILAGVFIIESFEQYFIDDASGRLDDIQEIIMPRLEAIDRPLWDETALEDIVTSHRELGLREELYVVDLSENRILATSTQNIGRRADTILDFDLLVRGLSGETAMKRMNLTGESYTIRTMDKIYPVASDGPTQIALYLRYNLEDIYAALRKARNFIAQATVLSAMITLLLGYFISKSITDPINEVTKKASLMAEGDFNQKITVASNDEIGQLGEMFNYLSAELKDSLSRISQEKSKMEAILHYMADGLIAVDVLDRVIHCNPRAKALFRTSDEETAFSRMWGAIEEIEHDDHVHSRVIHIDERYFQVNYAPFKNENGYRAGTVFLIKDITEQERLERMRKEFVANVSHELKTPLTSIKSYAETLMENEVDPETTNAFLHIINSETDRMGRLVKDLLQLSNFDASRSAFHFEREDLADLVKNTLFKVKVTAEKKNQSFDFSYREQEYPVEIDYDRMEQVLLNLFTNAMKYSDPATTIRVTLRQENGQHVLVIADEGYGIPEEDLSRIFERFYRVDKARSRELGGTGLGLSIAKEIVEAHGGLIAIESTLHEGTTVTIRLESISVA